MALFIIIQAGYTTYEIGIFSNDTCLEHVVEDKTYSSKNLIPTLERLLHKQNISLSHISAYGVNQGPAPFTSLRIAITTANGLSFATGIPLIGINGLEAFILEHTNPQWPTTIALLNAFNNDLYYAIQTDQGITIGCQNHQQLFAALQSANYGTIRFIGNGTSLYKNDIQKMFGTKAYMPDPMPTYCSLQFLAHCTHQRFEKKENFEKQLLPLYLKELQYNPSC